MMFLFAGHSAGLLSKNFVKQSFTKFLESQLHGSRRKSYLSVPFFFHLRYEWLVRGRLYLPNLRYELHHRICNLCYGTHGYGMSAYTGNGLQGVMVTIRPAAGNRILKFTKTQADGSFLLSLNAIPDGRSVLHGLSLRRAGSTLLG